jgi:hypothetical protein
MVLQLALRPRSCLRLALIDHTFEAVFWLVASRIGVILDFTLDLSAILLLVSFDPAAVGLSSQKINM